ncbi:MAG: rane-bound aldehyde dehydrogenase [Cereibacter sp.]|nr:rane-bound aldehyde dehydrogenase [Cereibacter sp.]
MDLALTRRDFLAAGSGLVVAFALTPALAQEAAPALPGSLGDAPRLDSWISISPEGRVTVFTGKAELGQGVKTALRMVAAEELALDPAEIDLVTADTGATPNEGYTAGSQSMANSGMAIRNAAANVRELLVAEAGRRLGVAPAGLRVEGGAVQGGAEALGYGELAAGLDLTVEARPDVPFRTGGARVFGSEVPRVDIPGKVVGAPAYVQDLRPEGMLHARVIRPTSPRATLRELDTASVEAMPGFVATVRDGNFLAVVAETEWQAVTCMRDLSARAVWDEQESLPDPDRLYDSLREMQGEVGTVAEEGAPETAGERSVSLTVTRPYTIHGSIGPSCAVAVMEEQGLTVWSHTQGVYPDRSAIAEMLGMPENQVRVVHVEGSGCYGHNGADDAAADAAMIARALPGRPIRLHWMREQEHGWEPYGPAMVIDAAARLDAEGRISDWTFDLWSNSHTSRPGGAKNLLAGQLKSDPFAFQPPALQISSSGNGDRNAVPYYTIPNKRILWHHVPEMPLRVSALRGLGAYANVFALESLMDELAILAGTDPVEFRLQHLDDSRAADVVRRVVDEGGWSSDPLPPNHGRGFAFARYKNYAGYLAMSVTLEVDPSTGRIRVHDVVAAIDSGEAVHVDGIRNQTEGGILQSLSWTLYEGMVFDRMRPTSIDWSSYPVLRFASVPDNVTVHVMDRPGEPFLGTGEAAQGPTAAAIGNALRNATGRRMTDLPLSHEKVRAVLNS